jgi:hypothetical protein
MHDPPPFVPADIRISPSGPYVFGAGGIVRFGADAIIEDQTLVETGASVAALQRTNTPAAALAVVFPDWRSGDTLWINWHLSGVWHPFIDAVDNDGDILIITPTVTIDPVAGPQFINNSELISEPTFDASEGGPLDQGFALSGTASFKIVNPKQPPIVQLFYQMLVNTPGEDTTAVVAGLNPTTDRAIGSGWLTACEFSQEVIFQQPPEVTLTPI